MAVPTNFRKMFLVSDLTDIKDCIKKNNSSLDKSSENITEVKNNEIEPDIPVSNIKTIHNDKNKIDNINNTKIVSKPKTRSASKNTYQSYFDKDKIKGSSLKVRQPQSTPLIQDKITNYINNKTKKSEIQTLKYNKLPKKCRICHKDFSNNRKLIHHINKIHSPEAKRNKRLLEL